MTLDTSWVRPLATLRSRGVGSVAVTLDAAAFARIRPVGDPSADVPPLDTEAAEARAKRVRALRHALAEYELKSYTITPARALGAVLVG